MTPAPSTGAGDRPHRVTLQNPGPTVPSPDGGYDIPTWLDLVPSTAQVKIEGATQQALERVAGGTIVTTATHLITMPYHPQVTERTRVLFNGRAFNITGVFNTEERNTELVLIAEEVKA